MAERHEQTLTIAKNLQEYGVLPAMRLLDELNSKLVTLEAILSAPSPKYDEISTIVNSLGVSIESVQSALRMGKHYERQLWNIVNLGK